MGKLRNMQKSKVTRFHDSFRFSKCFKFFRRLKHRYYYTLERIPLFPIPEFTPSQNPQTCPI
jgi:hypothetical protein